MTLNFKIGEVEINVSEKLNNKSVTGKILKKVCRQVSRQESYLNAKYFHENKNNELNSPVKRGELSEWVKK